MPPAALFVHNGVPSRFAFLAKALAGRGWQLALINERGKARLQGVATVEWSLSRGSTSGIYGPATRAEIDFLRGRAAAEAARNLKAQGFVPSVIIGHPGWGEMVFLGEVFPDTPQIQVAEFYYRSRGADVGFDPEFDEMDFDKQARVHAKNAALAMSYAEAACVVAPTTFQAQLLPPPLRSRCHVIHEGIDTELAHRRSISEVAISEGIAVTSATPTITFINRVLEPMRGFHIFMRALPPVLDALPAARVVIVGEDRTRGYGREAPGGGTWKQKMLAELGASVDTSRIHFVGVVPYERLLDILSVSTVHVYLTYPFVLSWSLLDAMACECLVIGSDTAPVREVIKPHANGLLVDFFDKTALFEKIVHVCRNQGQFADLRLAARRTILADYDRRLKCEPAWLALIDQVLLEANGR
jgi:glycosyltransferase involved in cell wall biosynthesis